MSSQQESNQSQPDTSSYPLYNIHHDRRIFLPRDRNNLELPSVFRPTPLRAYWYNLYGTEGIPQRSYSQLRPITYHPNALTPFYNINYDRIYDTDSNRSNVTETFPAQSSSQMQSKFDYNYARSIDYYNYSYGLRRLPFQGQKQLETFIGSNNTSNDTEILPPHNSKQLQSFIVHENSAFTPYYRKNNDIAMSQLEKKNLLLSSVGEGSDSLSTRFSSFNITDIIRPDNENNHSKSFIDVNNVPSTSQSNSSDGLKASHSEGRNLLESSVGSQNVTLPKTSSNNNSTHMIPSHNNNQLHLTSPTSKYNNYGLETFSQRSSNEMHSFIDYNYIPSEANYNHIYGTRTFQSQGKNQLEAGNGSNDASLTTFYGNNNYGTGTIPLRSNNQVQSSDGYNKAHSPSHNDDTLVSHSEDHNELPSSTGTQNTSLPTCSNNNNSRDRFSFYEYNQLQSLDDQLNPPSTTYSRSTDGKGTSPSQDQNQVKSFIGKNNGSLAAHFSNDETTMIHLDSHNQLQLATDNQNAPLTICSSNSKETQTLLCVDSNGNNQFESLANEHTDHTNHTNEQPERIQSSTCLKKVKKPYYCYSCGKSFTYKYKWAEHLYAHSIDKQFNCQVCNASFVHMSSFQRHARSHIRFKCKLCGKSFNRNNLFDACTHFQAYIDARPFACPHCERRYKSERSLNSHKLKHTDQTPDQN